MDQNEEVAMYGLTEVSACDGTVERSIVTFATMPMKNNVLIYKHTILCHAISTALQKFGKRNQGQMAY